MANGFRSYFLAYYAVGVVITVIAVVSDALRSGPVERRPEGGAKYLLPIVVTFWATLPLALILVRAGEIDAEWRPVRVLGVVLSLYTVAMEIWVGVTLGRFLVPRAVVFQEHALVTSGPYRLLRHPDYSAMLALWLGASLGTLDAWLLLLFPLAVLALWSEARVEERLLESRFGESYRKYARGRAASSPASRSAPRNPDDVGYRE